MKNNPTAALSARPATIPEHKIPGILLISLMVFLVFLSGLRPVYSTPGFARQTGLSCSGCHHLYPELNSFGREFMLSGYTLTNFTGLLQSGNKDSILTKLLSTTPLSVMIMASLTNINTKLPGTQNNNAELPQQLSLLYTGMISPHFATFLQLTYSGQDGSIGMDNMDIRYSNMALPGSKKLIYGMTLNNNPMIQDAWNSTRFPYASSSVAPGVITGPLLQGGLAQQVAGLGAYAYYNDLLYLEFSVYRSAPQGVALPPDSAATGIIKGVAPYGRVALQHQWQNHYLEVGATGMSTRLYPTGVIGLTNNFRDLAVDLLFEYTLPKSVVKVHPIWVHESRVLDAALATGGAVERKNTVNSLSIPVEFYTDGGFGAALSYFSIMGSTDTGLYAPGAVTGSRTGRPDSDGFVAEISYLPFYNTKLSLQYTMYNKFNGAASDYDGFGRSASGNNSLYLLLWFAF